MKRLCILLLCILTLFLLPGCGQKGQPDSQEPTAPVVEGQTVVVGESSVSTESTPAPTATPEPTPAPTPTPVPLSCAGIWKVELRNLVITLTITPDGSFTLVQGEQMQQGQVTEEGDTLQFVWENGGYSCGFELEGNTLLLKQEGYEDLIFAQEVSPE